jgi:hypothetical protein
MAGVTARIGDIVIDFRNPEHAAEFWCKALGYRVSDTDDTGVAIAGASSTPTSLFLRSTDRKLHKNRIHFGICPTHGTTRDDEVARLESLGATRIGTDPSDRSWVVTADPDGNEFCVMSTVLPHRTRAVPPLLSRTYHHGGLPPPRARDRHLCG